MYKESESTLAGQHARGVKTRDPVPRPEREPSAIDAEISRLQNALEETKAALCSLEEQLRPVLSEEDDGLVPAQVETTPVCGLASQIRVCTYIAESLRVKAIEVRQRLAI